MKKIFKKSNIFAFILGALIFGGIVGVSAYTILANDIGYTPKDSTWKKSDGEDITNVKDAIDELYSKANNQKVATQVATLTTQGASYTMQNDGYIIGTAQSSYNSATGIVYVDDVPYCDAYWKNPDAINVNIYASKGSVVSTRSSYGTYNLTVYEWK